MVLAFMELVAGVGITVTNKQPLTKQLKSERQVAREPCLRNI